MTRSIRHRSMVDEHGARRDDEYTWVHEIGAVAWSELSKLYRLAPL